jgi:nitrogen fixation/metabolism regulation signal transduction histidine kinase
MLEADWKARVELDMKHCTENRVRLEEHDKAQQKEIDTASEQLSDLYDYKNDIYRKITEDRANAAKIQDYRELATEVTKLKTEKKFLPYFVMVLTLLITIATAIYSVNKLTRGTDVNKSSNKIEAHERLPVLRSEMPENSR